jgi:hypothetical protein
MVTSIEELAEKPQQDTGSMPEASILAVTPTGEPTSPAHKNCVGLGCGGTQAYQARWLTREEETGGTIESINPETKPILTTIADASAAEVGEAGLLPSTHSRRRHGHRPGRISERTPC